MGNFAENNRGCNKAKQAPVKNHSGGRRKESIQKALYRVNICVKIFYKIRQAHNEKQQVRACKKSHAYGNSLTLPFEKQFYVGGASSMRGWQARCLGPGGTSGAEFLEIPSQCGVFKLEFDAEYRARLFWKLEAALFAEAGNVWNDLTDFYKTIALDWGVGLRVNLNFLVLRFDLGLRVHDPIREEGRRWVHPSEWFTTNGCAVHFGVGYPF